MFENNFGLFYKPGSLKALALKKKFCSADWDY